MHYIYKIKLTIINLGAHGFFSFMYKINILRATKTENKIVTSVTSQINVILNLQTYLLFIHVFIYLMTVSEKDQNM